MSRGMRLAFFGSPSFSIPTLEALHAAGHAIEIVFTQPPRPSGRFHRLTPCPVHARAEALGLAVATPRRLRGAIDEFARFEALHLDAGIVAAYGLILPREMLSAPRLGFLNVHASLLPRWRGASPIQAALRAGDPETGITIMQMDEGLDTGPILLREATPIGPRETADALASRLAVLGARLIVRAINERPVPIAQPETGATYAAKLGRADGVIDWHHDSRAIDRQIRALVPWPGTQATLLRHDGPLPLKILAAHPVAHSGQPGQVLDEHLTVGCGTGALRLDRVQMAGRPPVEAHAFLRGHPVAPGDSFATTR